MMHHTSIEGLNRRASVKVTRWGRKVYRIFFIVICVLILSEPCSSSPSLKKMVYKTQTINVNQKGALEGNIILYSDSTYLIWFIKSSFDNSVSTYLSSGNIFFNGSIITFIDSINTNIKYRFKITRDKLYCLTGNFCLIKRKFNLVSESFVINKDKKTLENEDLTIYMKCINKFPNFPKYLTENNQTLL